MLTSSDDCILSSGTYEHVPACSRADARYTTGGSSGRELPPFELPGVSKIEFATDRRSFATRLLIPPGIRQPRASELSLGNERLSSSTTKLRFRLRTLCTLWSSIVRMKDLTVKKCFAAINCALVRNFRAADPHCNCEWSLRVDVIYRGSAAFDRIHLLCIQLYTKARNY